MRKRTLVTDRRQRGRASENNASMNGETSVVEFPVALCFLFMFPSCHVYEGVSSPPSGLFGCSAGSCLPRPVPVALLDGGPQCHRSSGPLRRDAEGQGKGALTTRGHRCGLFSLGQLAEK